MPRLKIHDVLDAAARWAGGDRDAFDRAMREGEQQASARSRYVSGHNLFLLLAFSKVEIMEPFNPPYLM